MYSCIYCSIIFNSQYGNNISFCQWTNIWRCSTYNGSLKDTGLNRVGPVKWRFLPKVFTLNMYYGTGDLLDAKLHMLTPTTKLYMGIHAPNSASFKGLTLYTMEFSSATRGKNILPFVPTRGWVWEHYAKRDKSKTMTSLLMWNL